MCKCFVEIKEGKIIKSKGHFIICTECGIIEIKRIEKKKRKRKNNE